MSMHSEELARNAINTLELSGIEHMRAGDLNDAERDLQEALHKRREQHPEEPSHPTLTCAINNLAVLHLKQNRFEEAAAGFEKMIFINEQAHLRQPCVSARLALETNAAKRNLATARRLAAQAAPPPPPLPPSPQFLEIAPPPASSDPSSSSAADDGWAAVRGAARGNVDALKSAARKNKELIAKKLGVDVRGLREGEIDEAIRRNVCGDVDVEPLRISIGIAFDMLDEDGDGKLSRMETLRGLKAKPQVSELLQIGPFSDPAEFDAVYRSIDADGSNTLDRREFESYFLSRLGPRTAAASQYHALPETMAPASNALSGRLQLQGGRPPAQSAVETSRERDLRLSADASMRFLQAGHAAAQRRYQSGTEAARADTAATQAATPLSVSSALAPSAAMAVGGGQRTTHAEWAELSEYDEVARSLEKSQQRRLDLQSEVETLQEEMRIIEADIVAKASSADRLRGALLERRQLNDAATASINERITEIDRTAKLALRPHLRTAERLGSM
jgi:tetratricopeptide (TPR) repeat protein